jgi:transposase InsO family protein
MLNQAWRRERTGFEPSPRRPTRQKVIQHTATVTDPAKARSNGGSRLAKGAPPTSPTSGPPRVGSTCRHHRLFSRCVVGWSMSASMRPEQMCSTTSSGSVRRPASFDDRIPQACWVRTQGGTSLTGCPSNRQQLNEIRSCGDRLGALGTEETTRSPMVHRNADPFQSAKQLLYRMN